MTDAVSPDVAESVGASVKISASEGAGPRAAAGPISARRWSNEEKARIVEESERPGVALRDVAQRHGVSAQSLREWRRQAALAAAGCRPGSGRPWPDDVKARIVAECEEAGVRLGDVARRHGVSEKTLRKWRRLAAHEGVLSPVTGAGSAASFVPVEVDGASSVQSVTIEALGVVVRLPVESPVERIVAVASGLGRAS